jgi:hypothetical protein
MQTFFCIANKEIIATDEPRWIEAQQLLDAATDHISACEDELIEIRPTTVAGVIAILRYAVEYEKAEHGDGWPPSGYADDDGDHGSCRAGYSWSYFLHKRLAEVLERIAA